EPIKIDPNYALAYAGLADCYGLSIYYSGYQPNDFFPRVKEAAMKALEIDNSLAEAHTSLAFVLMNYEREWPAAEKEFKQAIELNPNYATAHDWYGIYLMLMSRFDESKAEFKRAQEL